MPLPMVHLFVTERIFKEKGIDINADFLLGSISPDAIHMRENTTRVDKQRTHFGMGENSTVEDIFHNNMRPFFDPLRENEQWFWFAKGYMSHVITDLFWQQTVFRDFKSKISGEQINNERSLYYMDTDQIDFNFYKKEPWRPSFWEVLGMSTAVDIPDILSAEEIEKWKMRTLHWFNDTAKEPRIEPAYITEEIVRQFVEDTSRQLIRLYEQAEYL
jgi:hypothetical protein